MLANFFQTIRQSAQCKPMPTKGATEYFIDELINFLFPFRQQSFDYHALEKDWQIFHLNLQKLVEPLVEDSVVAEKIVADFFQDVPSIYELLCLDAETILQNDPAANSFEEVVLAYPGFYAIAVYRLSNTLYRLKTPMLPRIISEHAHSLTGIDIHPGATIGKHFFIDHGTGIVIGETTLIGDFVKIYQGVTLGALSVKKSESDVKRHPTIESNVTIYSNSTILGGNTIIGNNTLIGGNVFLTYSVPAYSMVYQKSEVKVRQVEESFIEVEEK